MECREEPETVGKIIMGVHKARDVPQLSCVDCSEPEIVVGFHHGDAESRRRSVIFVHGVQKECREPETLGQNHHGCAEKPETFRNCRAWTAQSLRRSAIHQGRANSLRRSAIPATGLLKVSDCRRFSSWGSRQPETPCNSPACSAHKAQKA